MKNIAIICGGYSGEYEISVQSASMVKSNLNEKLYNSYIIVIEQDDWYYQDNRKDKYSVNKNNFTLSINDQVIFFDGVFNAIHGTPGEDGKILGYFDILKIPYTSCSMDVSALTFNKYLCNNFVKSLGLNVANSISFVKGETIDKDQLINTLGLPLFVKPARSGSSVGVTKVYNRDELEGAIAEAIKVDDRIIIEEFLNGREIDCGVFKNKNELIVLPLTEIITDNEFFDYEAKYTSGKADEVTPPQNLNDQHELDIKAVSAMLYNKIGCDGIVRFDYILTKEKLYFIEVNSVPGLSQASIVPKQAKAMGISVSELFNIVVENMFL